MKDARFYTALPYAIEVLPDVTTEGHVCYVAKHPELSGCMSHGNTPEEALAHLAEARELYLTTMLEDGLEPPKPVAMENGGNTPFIAIWTSVVTSHPVATAIKSIPTGRLTSLGEGLVTSES